MKKSHQIEKSDTSIRKNIVSNEVNKLSESLDNGSSNTVLSNGRDKYTRRFSVETCNILNELRCEGFFCDAVIQVSDGTEFSLHKAILSASSNYYKALFTNQLTDSKQREFLIADVDSDMMQLIIEWAYTRDVAGLNQENVVRLLPVADRFGAIGLVERCVEFIEKNISCENVIGIRRFASFYFCPHLKNSATNFIMRNFVELSNRSEEIFDIEHEELIEIIKSDQLNIKYEEDVFNFVLKWINYDLINRRKFAIDLLKSVRLGLVSREFILDIQTDLKHYPYIKECKTILDERLRRSSLHYINIKYPFSDYSKRPRIPHELIVVIGGWSGEVPTNSIEYFDPRANKWFKSDILDKTPRAYHGCVTIEKYIYIIGGFDGSDYYNNCRRLNVVSRQWHQIAPMNCKRCYVSVASYQGIIYAMGGFDGGATRLKSAERFNPTNNQWSLIADMNEMRSDASAAELNGMIYICGGFNGTECLDSAECYDPKTNVWTLIRPMLNRRSGIGVVSFRNCLYAVGGFDGEKRLSACEKYNPVDKVWTKIVDMNSTRSNFAIEVLEESIYVMGGFNGITTTEQVECFNERLGWRITQKMNLNRSALSACVLRGIDYIKPYSSLNYHIDNFI